VGLTIPHHKNLYCYEMFQSASEVQSMRVNYIMVTAAYNMITEQETNGCIHVHVKQTMNRCFATEQITNGKNYSRANRNCKCRHFHLKTDEPLISVILLCFLYSMWFYK